MTPDSQVRVLEQELFESDRWASAALKDMHNERVLRLRREEQLRQVRQKLKRAERDLMIVRKSFSWKITRPLRAVRKFFKRPAR